MLLHYSPGEGVDITGDQADFSRLAELLMAGAELHLAAAAEEGCLSGVLVEAADGNLLIGVDDRSYLTVRGGEAGRSILAEELRDTGDMEDGGHVHIEYFEGHHYLAAGSIPLILTSPHGGMPRR